MVLLEDIFVKTLDEPVEIKWGYKRPVKDAHYIVSLVAPTTVEWSLLTCEHVCVASHSIA